MLETKHADYRFRSFIHRDRVKGALITAVDVLDYSNFKNSIADAGYHDAASAAWSVMYRLQSDTQPPRVVDDLFDPPSI